jgi:hypothetical protein
VTASGAVILRLKQIAALTALVGQEIWPIKFRQSQPWPAVRVTQIGRDEPMTLRGPVNLLSSRIQVDVAATTKSGADAAMDAVHGNGQGQSASGLNGWIGSIGSPALSIRTVFSLDEGEDFDSEELNVYRKRRDYRVVWSA